ncbi:PA14 domain-containing protein [Maribacter litopenaei]|uniref:PA14 domain-containing protein n=1 Tax=Maribacter litopenaei TaxID=2976127 RepID=A0ABY5Y4Y0_9FLAO|nr:PA14 domain-containing protein [Maribacter litopenaei]UWX54058.1 PA14 domain-containing protein [Maribacter litopenaei]
MDAFSNNAYNNNDGNSNFSNDWTEIDVNGGGATGGNIYVSYGELVFDRINRNDEISRGVDLSGITKDVVLTFDYDATSRGNERLRVYLYNSTSNNWQNITTLQISTTGTVTYTLSNNQKSNQSAIRFRSSSNDWDAGESIAIDNITFRIEDQPPVVTATGNQDFCPGTSLPVVETISITDPDDPTIQEVSIQVSNGYVDGEDLLTLTGTHPAITSSWIASEGRLVLTGPATSTEFENAVLAVEYSNSSLSAYGSRDFSIIVGDAYFLPDTGHYYQFFSDIGITWTSARDKAALSTYFGLQGYLATLTSAEESNFAGSQISGAGWIGGSDAAVEGEWRWVTGSETGTIFWNGLANGSTPNYAFWNTGEPNQSGDEDYAHITANGTGIDGSWNDLSNTGAGSGAYQPKGYVVEYGGMPGDPTVNVSASTTINITQGSTITSQPADQSIIEGNNATFNAGATGSNLLFQWQVSMDNGASYNDIAGATGASVTINNVSFSDDGNRYRVLVSESGSSCAQVISDFGLLTVVNDSDGDGYADTVDLDDDNDGILDSDENPDCSVANSLFYEFYDLVPSGNTVDNIPNSGALATGYVSNFDVAALQNNVDPGDTDSFSIRYRGQIDITTSGNYTFFTNSDDGSKLFIDGVEVVDNDGDHGAVEVSSSPISLSVGLHDIEITYYENGGGQTLQVLYQGPSIAKQQMPFSILSTTSVANLVYNGDFESFYYDGWTRTGNQWQEPTNDRALFEDYSAATSTFAQDLTTVIGTTYTVSFDLGVNTAFPNTSNFRVLAAGNQLYSDTSTNIESTNGGSNIMVNRTLTFTATATTSTLLFEGSSAVDSHHEFFVDNIAVYEQCTSVDNDIDNDGIVNSLDLDSDGDGCPDALEGAISNSQINFSSLNPDGSLSGGVDANGVPLIVSGGQGGGTSDDPLLQATECSTCNSLNPAYVDTDSDGVGDYCDLDDDNDGIYDTEECSTQYPDLSGISGASQLDPGDPDFMVSMASDGNSFSNTLTFQSPVALNGATSVNIEGEQLGAEFQTLRMELNSITTNQGLTSNILYSNRELVQVVASNGFGNSNINQSDSIVITAVGAPVGFIWQLNSSSDAEVTVNGNTVSITGSLVVEP